MILMADFDGSGKLSPSARLNEEVTFGKMTKVSACGVDFSSARDQGRLAGGTLFLLRTQCQQRHFRRRQHPNRHNNRAEAHVGVECRAPYFAQSARIFPSQLRECWRAYKREIHLSAMRMPRQLQVHR